MWRSSSPRTSTQPRYVCFSASPATAIYTLSLHDALPICQRLGAAGGPGGVRHQGRDQEHELVPRGDRKSTRLNSSHVAISYAVFCLKKKKLHYTRTGRNRECRGPDSEIPGNVRESRRDQA